MWCSCDVVVAVDGGGASGDELYISVSSDWEDRKKVPNEKNLLECIL